MGYPSFEGPKPPGPLGHPDSNHKLNCCCRPKTQPTQPCHTCSPCKSNRLHPYVGRPWSLARWALGLHWETSSQMLGMYPLLPSTKAKHLGVHLSFKKIISVAWLNKSEKESEANHPNRSKSEIEANHPNRRVGEKSPSREKKRDHHLGPVL